MRFLGLRGLACRSATQWDFGLGKGPPGTKRSDFLLFRTPRGHVDRGSPALASRRGVTSQVTRKMQVMSRIGVSVPFKVMPATQTRSGSGAAKCRPIGSGAGAIPRLPGWRCAAGPFAPQGWLYVMGAVAFARRASVSVRAGFAPSEANSFRDVSSASVAWVVFPRVRRDRPCPNSA
jgi:hypothetical protein